METGNTQKQQNVEIGALWKREARASGQKYLAGHIKMDDGMGSETTTKVVVFSNRHKDKETQPDFRMYLSKPQQPQQEQESVAESTNESVEETAELL